jgi:hypothetical protein
MTTYPLLSDYLVTTSNLLVTTTTTYTYIIDNNNKRVGGDDRARIYVKSTKSSLISIKAVIKYVISRQKAVITTLHRLSCFSFCDSSYKKQGVVQRLRGLTSLNGNICLFYAFYYIKYIKKYIRKYTDRYIFEEMC